MLINPPLLPNTRIAMFLLIIFIFMSLTNLTNAKETTRVQRDDCNLSFLSPANLEYIGIDDPIVTGKDKCYIAFKYTGNLRIKSDGYIPAMPEDWRAMTDFSLTIKNIPLPEEITEIESADGAEQNGLFRLKAKKHIPLVGGDLYILRYFATKPTKNMINLHQTEKTVFVAGNNIHSTTSPLYSGKKPTKKELEKRRVFMDLFSSFQFSTVFDK